MTCNKIYADIMDQILRSLNINTTDLKMNVSGNNDNSLNYPYSKVTVFITQLFSMEFGSPPLYAELNRICHT